MGRRNVAFKIPAKTNIFFHYNFLPHSHNWRPVIGLEGTLEKRKKSSRCLVFPPQSVPEIA